MFGHIYKLDEEDDNKWHLSSGHNGKTDCGLTIHSMNLAEDRIIGQKGDKYYPDPPVSEVCSKCFHFLPAFNNTGNA